MAVETVEAIFKRMIEAGGKAMVHHMPTLRELAKGRVCAEFGVRAACSTVALLASAERVYSWDVEQLPKHKPIHDEIKAAAGDRWTFTLGSSLTAELPKGGVDLLFHDSLHNYEHVCGELDRHADKVKSILAFHDSNSHGDQGQAVTCGPREPTVMGIRPAIDELMIRDRSWRIRQHDPQHSGMLVLERCPMKMAAEGFDRYRNLGAYHWKAYDEGKFGVARTVPKRAAFVRHVDGLVDRIAAAFRPDSVLLDVGCGDGLLLGLLRHRGFQQSHGIDADEEGVRLAKSKGIDASCRSVYKLGDETGVKWKADVVILSDVIEHLMWPEEAMHVLLQHTTAQHFVVSTPRYNGFLGAYHFREFGAEELEAFMAGLGLKCVDRGETAPGKLYARFQR